jgi:hypothetical protein
MKKNGVGCTGMGIVNGIGTIEVKQLALPRDCT